MNNLLKKELLFEGLFSTKVFKIVIKYIDRSISEVMKDRALSENGAQNSSSKTKG